MKRRAILLAVLITFMYSTHIPAVTFYIWKDDNDVVHIEDVRPTETTEFEKIEIEGYSIDSSASDGGAEQKPSATEKTGRAKAQGEERNFIRSFADSFIEFFRIPERDKERDDLTATQRNLDRYLHTDKVSPEAQKE